MTAQFTALSRALHWLMALAILTMLFIGVAMIASLSCYHALIGIHKPLGILILALAAIRLINRLLNPPPALPAQLPKIQKFAAAASHYLLYTLMVALPLIGWAMLSAGNLPITLYGAWHLPAILAPNPMLYAILRKLHGLLALLFFATILVHLAAALLHGLILRDGVFPSMASFDKRKT